IDRRLEPRDQVEELRVDCGDAFRQRSVKLIERNARLKRRRGVDQVGDRLRLHEIALAVQKRAQRELAWLGQPRAVRNRAANDRLQNDGTSVRGDLDDIVAGVRVRRGKQRGDDFVDGRSWVRLACIRSLGGTRPTYDARECRVAWLKRRAARE